MVSFDEFRESVQVHSTEGALLAEVLLNPKSYAEFLADLSDEEREDYYEAGDPDSLAELYVTEYESGWVSENFIGTWESAEDFIRDYLIDEGLITDPAEAFRAGTDPEHFLWELDANGDIASIDGGDGIIVYHP